MVEESGKGCINIILILIALAMLLMMPALVGVSELAQRDRVENVQVGR